jgi:predicted transcriptional regulator
MNPPSGPHPRQRRYRVRQQARLDAETFAKLEELAAAFHRKRAQILRYVRQWGLDHRTAWTIDPSIPDHPHLVHMLVEPDLLQHVQEAAENHSVTVAAWLRQAMRQVTLEEFSASWREGKSVPRSHESGYYHRTFGLRLDAVTSHTLEVLTQTFDRSAAEIIRQLIAQARSEVFPESWQLAVEECRQPDARQTNRITS